MFGFPFGKNKTHEERKKTPNEFLRKARRTQTNSKKKSNRQKKTPTHTTNEKKGARFFWDHPPTKMRIVKPAAA